MMSSNCASKKLAKIYLWISVAVLVISIGTLISFESIYGAILKTYITLGKGSLVTKIWEDIPLPIYEKLYFFNITNSKAFLDGYEPLNVAEVGPYTFKARWIKEQPLWHPNYTVSYREQRIYHFVPELSNGTQDDLIYTLNGPMILGASAIPPFAISAYSYFCKLKGEKVIIKKSIRELAYEGYSDTIIQKARIFKPDVPYKDGKFSWLYGQNASDDGLFTVFTGTDDVSKTDLMNRWNGRDTLNFWGGDSCNMINGTSIETGPPIKGHQDSYTFFQSIFCRSITFHYTNDSRHYNILSKRFRPTYSLFANSTENPDNSCFEINKERPSGVLDISPCQFGAPVLVSFPHFHLADPSYLKSVKGMHPNDEQHGSYIDVEPITGVSIDLTVRFQINLDVHKMHGFPELGKLTGGVLPVFWTELSLKIDEDLANFLKSSLNNPKIIAYSVLGVLTFISFIAVIVSSIYLYVSKNKDYDDLLIDAVSSKTSFQAKNNDCNERSKIVSGTNIKENYKTITTNGENAEDTEALKTVNK